MTDLLTRLEQAEDRCLEGQDMSTTDNSETGACRHCGYMHPNMPCPRVKAIEYYPDGRVKRVEYIVTKREQLAEILAENSLWLGTAEDAREMIGDLLAGLREPDDRMRKASRFLTLPDGTKTTFEDQEGDAVWQARIDAVE